MDKFCVGEPTIEEVVVWLNKRKRWDMHQDYDCAQKALDIILEEAMRIHGQEKT